MFLDAWLRLGIFGPVVLLALLFGLLTVGLALYRAVVARLGLRRNGEFEHTWLKVATAGSLCITVAGLLASGFVDRRLERHLVLDLRQPQRTLLTELRRCGGNIDDGCDSNKYTVTADVIMPEGQRLSVRTEYLHWAADKGRLSIEIRDADANSLSLQGAHELLTRHVASVSEQLDAESKRQIDHAGKWLLECCTGNKVYSKTLGIQLSPQFGLQFYKNVDEVAVAYLLRSAP